MAETLVYVKLAEQAERYDDMAKYMKQYVEESGEMSSEARNLLSVAYKNVVGSRRSSFRILSNLKVVGEYPDIAEEFKTKVVDEVKSICDEVVALLRDHLIPKATEVDSKVFYHKMQGDYYRYLCEVTTDNEKEENKVKAEEAYNEATKEAATMEPTHPIRLGLALNFSVFCYEIVESTEKACKQAKKAFDDAIAELDTLQDDSYKDSTLIMQLLRDNLTLWTASNEDGEEPEEDQS